MEESSTDTLKRNLRRVEIQEGRVISLLHLTDNIHRFHEDTTIFFYHGAMASWEQFDHIIHYFKQYFNVVAYDAFGCGRSDKPYDPIIWGDSHYSADKLIDDAVSVFDRYATAKNILVGHSFGTAVVGKVNTAIRSREDHDEKQILGSILLGTHHNSPVARHPIFFLPVFLLDAIQGMLSTQFTELAFSRDCDPAIKERSITLSNKNQMHVAKSFYSNFSWATAEDWKAVSEAPVLICQGSDDLITPLEAAQTLFDDHFQDLQHAVYETVPGAGHQLMMEKPDQLIQIMERFLRDKCGLIFD